MNSCHGMNAGNTLIATPFLGIPSTLRGRVSQHLQSNSKRGAMGVLTTPEACESFSVARESLSERKTDREMFADMP